MRIREWTDAERAPVSSLIWCAVVWVFSCGVTVAQPSSGSERHVWHRDTVSGALAGWHGIDCGDSGLCVISCNLGYGLQNRILVSTDAGKNWSVSYDDTIVSGEEVRPSPTVGNVAVIGSNLIFVPDNSGRVLRSVDRGNSWTNVRALNIDSLGIFPDLYDPPSISMADGRNGLLIYRGRRKKDSVLAHLPAVTRDSGLSWTLLQASPIPPQWNAASVSVIAGVMPSADRIVIVLDGPPGSVETVAVSHDSGKTWTHRTIPEPPDPSVFITDVSFPTPDVGYIVGDKYKGESNHRAYVAKTEDGGMSWKRVYYGNIATDESSGLYSVDFRTALSGLAAGWGFVARTTDGGKSWTADSLENLKRGLTKSGRVAWLSSTRAIMGAFRGGVLFTWDANAASVSEGFRGDGRRALIQVNAVNVQPDGVSVRVDASLRRASDVSYRVFDIRGRELLRRRVGLLPQGEQSISCEFPYLPSGAYFLRMEAGNDMVHLPFQLRC